MYDLKISEIFLEYLIELAANILKLFFDHFYLLLSLAGSANA